MFSSLLTSTPFSMHLLMQVLTECWKGMKMVHVCDNHRTVQRGPRYSVYRGCTVGFCPGSVSAFRFENYNHTLRVLSTSDQLPVSKHLVFGPGYYSLSGSTAQNKTKAAVLSHHSKAKTTVDGSHLNIIHWNTIYSIVSSVFIGLWSLHWWDV